MAKVNEASEFAWHLSVAHGRSMEETAISQFGAEVRTSAEVLAFQSGPGEEE